MILWKAKAVIVLLTTVDYEALHVKYGSISFFQETTSIHTILALYSIDTPSIT
jgi:hypothetical protein